MAEHRHRAPDGAAGRDDRIGDGVEQHGPVRREEVTAPEPHGGRPGPPVRAGVEVDEWVDGPQLAQLVEEQQRERHLIGERWAGSDAPVGDGALVEALRNAVDGALLTGRRPKRRQIASALRTPSSWNP